MKTSVIKYRVSDFLKQYPPFNELSELDLLRLATSGRVIFHESDEYIFRKNQPAGKALWVIQQGSVEIVDETPQGEQLRDMLAEGDILGSEHAAGISTYACSARTASDVILYSIDTTVFEEVTAQNPTVASYVANRLSSTRPAAASVEIDRNRAPNRRSWLDTLVPPRGFPPSLIVQNISIREAALEMRSAKSEWIAVTDARNLLLGLVTTRELRNHIAAGFSAEDCIETIVDTGIPTTPPGLPAARYFLQMMRNRCRSLMITVDGSRGSALQHVLTDVDLSLYAGRNPVLLLLQMLEAKTADQWTDLLGLAREVIAEALTAASQVDCCAQMAAEFLRALTEAVIRCAQDELTSQGFAVPAAPHCWLLFGSSGRSDAVVPGRPEIGVVYAEDKDSAGYFSAVIDRTSALLSACGLPSAATPGKELRLSRSLAEWKQFFSACITDPITNAVYLSRAMFDFQPLFGERRLAEEIRRTITAQLEHGGSFIAVMANDTMSNLPPLTFFRGLVIELDGAQRDTLDVQKTALDPITDAARVFSLRGGNLNITSTLERLAKAAVAFPDSAAILEEAAQSFRIIVYQNTHAGFRGESDGVIRPSTLNKYDQRLLKSAFDSIQRLLELSSRAFEEVA